MQHETSYRRLYTLLLGMERAAAAGDKVAVTEINRPFSDIYAKTMPRPYEKGSVPDLLDKARNQFIDAIDDLVAPTPEEKEKHLEKGRALLARLSR